MLGSFSIVCFDHSLQNTQSLSNSRNVLDFFFGMTLVALAVMSFPGIAVPPLKWLLVGLLDGDCEAIDWFVISWESSWRCSAACKPSRFFPARILHAKSGNPEDIVECGFQKCCAVHFYIMREWRRIVSFIDYGGQLHNRKWRKAYGESYLSMQNKKGENKRMVRFDMSELSHRPVPHLACYDSI